MAATNMTQGRVGRHLIGYAVPLVLGNLFQLMYNVVDSVIAGRFIGKEALAAAGTANPVMSIVILGISGLCVGAGVLMSEAYGAGEHDKLRSEMATTLLFGLYFSLAVSVLGFAASGLILRLIRVPQELLPMATSYLRIIFLGTPFTYCYNALSSSLKSIGDSATPLRFLMFSSVFNAVLDIVLIGFLGFGIRCSAATTVAAQAVSAVLAFRHVYAHVPVLQVRRGGWKMDHTLLGQMLRFGSVTALQQAVQPVAKLLIQGAVNPLGVEAMAAFNAAERVDDFALLPERSLSVAMTTFVAQNRGAQKRERVQDGFRKGMLMEIGYGLIICVVLLIFNEPLMRLFASGSDADALVHHGGRYLRTMAVFYVLPALSNGVQGFFRGMGDVAMTLRCTLLQTTLRVLCTYLLTPVIGISGIAIGCVIGWSAMMLYEIPMSIRTLKRWRMEENAEKIKK